MKNGIFITARIGSTRLPKKHLLKIQNKHCIEYCFEGAKKSKESNLIILCTTILKEDDILVSLAKKHNIEIFRGSVKDKLERWNKACKKYNIESFCTYDADDLFCSNILIDEAFNQYRKNKADLIRWENCNIICGSFTYLLSSKSLDKICQIKDTNDTEMFWEYYIKTNLFKIEDLKNIPYIFKQPKIRLTLDYAEDFHLISTIIDHFYKIEQYDFDLYDIAYYLTDNPELIKINQHCHKEWKENQINKTKMILK